MDDSLLLGPPSDLAVVLPIVKKKASEIELYLASQKSVLCSRSPFNKAEFPPDIIQADPSGLEVLGAPIGNTEFIFKVVLKKVKQCQKLWEVLEEIGDPQTELLLLRIGMSWSKLGYLLRTSPISDVDWSPYDKGMKQNLERKWECRYRTAP